MTDPYGITQVDVPGLLNAYMTGQDRRMSRALQAEQLREAQVKLDQQTQAAKALKDFYTPQAPTGGVQGAADAYSAPSSAPDASVSPPALPAPNPQDDPQRQQQLIASLAGTMAPKDVIDLQNAFSTHNEAQKKAAAEQWNQIGATALEIRNTPPDQRLAAFDQQTPMLQSLGVQPQVLQQVRSQIASGNSDQYLEGLVNHVRDIEKVISGITPTVLPVAGVGAYPVTPGSPFRNFSEGGAAPSATVGANLPQVNSPEDAAKLAPGTQFRLPDGRIGTVPGGTAGNGGGNFPNIERYYNGE
jgi:hypothetical protein